MMNRGAGRRALGVVFWLCLLAEAGQAPSPLVSTGPSDVAGVTKLRLDAERYAAIKGAKSVTIQGFPLSHQKSVDLELTPFDVFADDAVVVATSDSGERRLPRPDVVLLHGQVAGIADSRVYLALAPTGSQGFIEAGGQSFIISSGPYGHSQGTVIYDRDAISADAMEWKPFECLADLLGQPQPKLQGGGSGASVLDEPPCRVAEVALETDREFTSALFGGDLDAAAAYAELLTGAVSEIYKRDINASLKISYLRLWETSADPWNQGDTYNQILQFIDYWETNMRDVVRDDAHFYSGRGLGGGIAYLPGLCQGEYAYALSANLGGSFPYPLQDKHPQNWDPMVVAHEFGHNFGAPHTHDMNPPVDRCAQGVCGVDGTIMSYCHLCPGGMTNIVLKFHERSINEEMLPYLDQLTCPLTQHPDCGGGGPPPVGPCKFFQRSVTVCRPVGGKVKGIFKSRLPEGFGIVLTLNGKDELTTWTNKRGNARVTWHDVPEAASGACQIFVAPLLPKLCRQ